MSTDGFVLKDFNHTQSQRHSKKEREEITRLINALIDEAMVAKHLSEPSRNYIGASQIGDECLRRIQYDTTRVAKPPPSGKLLRIFQRGHVFEEVVIEWMRLAGFDLSVVRPEEPTRQYGFKIANGQIRGNLDGIIMNGPYIPGLLYPCVWECKVLGAKGFSSVVEKGVTEAYPKYAAQGFLYQAYMELENPELYTVLNADTMDLHHEPVPFDVERAQWASDRGVQILEANACGELLPRIAGDPDKYPCRFCDFREHCHDGTPQGGDLGPVRKG